MVSCSTASQAQRGPNYIPTEIYGQGYVRGGMGLLTAAEVEVMKGLAWPQTRADMEGTFGKSHQVLNGTDIYRIEDSGKKVWVFYDGTQAISFEIK